MPNRRGRAGLVVERQVGALAANSFSHEDADTVPQYINIWWEAYIVAPLKVGLTIYLSIGKETEEEAEVRLVLTHVFQLQ